MSVTKPFSEIKQGDFFRVDEALKFAESDAKPNEGEHPWPGGHVVCVDGRWFSAESDEEVVILQT